MGIISKLSDEVVNQIAAGEVVERPSSLVKELVENALDAGADRVEVQIDNGGRNITVSDNGRGIAKEDMALSLARHCTSKIRNTSDLWQLNSYGFRGEALASIGSVSRLDIVSRQINDSLGHLITSNFGKICDVKSQSSDQGTTIKVQNLFENVPARLKFLKTANHEVNQIRQTVKAMALVNPQVEFRVKVSQKLVDYFAKAINSVERAKQVLEQSLVFESTGEYQDFKIQVIFCSPKTVAGSNRQIWLFVQNRWVVDRGLQAAVMDAYRGLLMHGEYPVVSLFLNCDPQAVDVNVHPMKSQVKFRDSSSAFKAANRTLREGLEKSPWIESLKNPIKSFEREQHTSMPHATPQSTPLSFDLMEFGSYQAPQKMELLRTQPVAIVKENYWANLNVIGQSRLTYIIAESDNHFLLIDQHAAHERVAFEKLMRGYLNGKLEIQDFLFPITVNLGADGVERILSQKDILVRFGIDVDAGGIDSVFIRSAPVVINESALEITLKKMADEMEQKGGTFAFEKIISDICASLACHSVVRAGQALSTTEMRALLTEMDEFPFSSFCPHGRPVSLEIPFSKIEHDFGRIK
ncbi:MAG: DNA mismatch repair endonuclease MutL [Pseudomonadota bacterium]|nr:DNA mismatch repair endonuclease MutL [Pseudomonadota bacterium]